MLNFFVISFEVCATHVVHWSFFVFFDESGGGHVLTNRAAEHSVNPFITAAASGTSSEPVAPLQPVGVAGEEHVRRGCGSFSCGDHLYFAAWLDWLRNRALGWR